jgi:ferredoxin-nitrite reductase
MATKGFTEAQKQYLEGLVSGLRAAHRSGWGEAATAESTARDGSAPPGPDRALWEAQDRFLAAGQRLAPEENATRRQPPEDLWRRITVLSRQGRFPEADEVFLYKFHGLFYVSPVEESFMCRLRFAAGQITSHQLAGVADLAERFGHPVMQLTTRGNLQLRGIGARSALDVLMGLTELGILNRGTGGDGVRNIRANPTAGFDRRELLDVSALARGAQYRILADRALQALPRKFALAFDGGGSLGAQPESCDLGFRAVRLESHPQLPEGIYFRLLLGGATSHGRTARDAGVLVAPERALDTMEAVLQLYAEHGDRTNRRRARLLYLLESWGLERFMLELETRLGPPALPRWPLERCQLPEPPDPFAHIGFHNQKPRGKSYAGIVLPLGQLSLAQARGLARLAAEHGSGELRLTPAQNLLIPGLADTQLHRVKDALSALGLGWSASAFRAGLIACTGSAGCQFAAGDVKRRAEELVRHLEGLFNLEEPLTIHVSGCHHSCAEHTLADIGLLALRPEPGAGDAECYQLFLGGQQSANGRFARELASRVPAAEVPSLIQRVVESYLAERRERESFREFVGRVSPGRAPAAVLPRAMGPGAVSVGGGARS